nr:ribonuclease D [Motiliproteus sediminis]
MEQTVQARFDQKVAAAEWVDSQSRLEALCLQWRQQPVIGLDTEFIRTDTFYPKPGLIQVACAQGVYLIDPLAIDSMAPLVGLFEDSKVLKVLHACSEDLELFASSYGAVPQPLFDTQVACAFAGFGLSIGYQRLLETFFNFSVDKQETRSDWLQRPLTESQRRYAALDVVYLDEIYQRLATRLREKGSYDWVLAECQQLADEALVTPDPDQYYHRFRQAWKLKPQQLKVLQSVSAWREREARVRDMPRNFLLHNNSVVGIAMKQPRTLGELSRIEQIRGRTLSKDGEALLSLVAAAQDSATVPEAPGAPLPSSEGNRVKVLKKTVQAVAAEWDIAPELLVRKRDLEALVRSGMGGGGYCLPQGLTGWREPLIGQPLLQALQQTS